MEITGCYTPNGEHRMSGNACTVCLRELVMAPSAPATPEPSPEPLRPWGSRTAPAGAPPVTRPRWARRLVKWAVIGGLCWGTVAGCSNVIDQADEPLRTEHGISQCFGQDGYGPSKTCVWTGEGRDFTAYNYGTKIVYRTAKGGK